MNVCSKRIRHRVAASRCAIAISWFSLVCNWRPECLTHLRNCIKTTMPRNIESACDHDASKRCRSKDEPADDMPPPKPKQLKPKPVRCSCTCDWPETRSVLVADDDPEAGEFVHRCICPLCGDHKGCKTRLHFVYLMFAGPVCEECLGHPDDHLPKEVAKMM